MNEKESTRTLLSLRNTNTKTLMRSSANYVAMSPINETTIFDVLIKASRHKSLIAVILLLTLGITLSVFALKGSWYEKETVAQYNNYENNSLFQYLDNFIPSDSKVNWDSPAEYAARALHALKSDDFLRLILNRASVDPELKTAFGLGSFEILINNRQAYEALYSFFRRNVEFSTQMASASKSLLSSGGGRFKIIVKSRSLDETDLLATSLQRVINDFVAKREVDDVQAARKLVSDLLTERKGELQVLSNQLAKIQSETPADLSYNYQTVELGLQGVRATLAGNASLLSRYSGILMDIEGSLRSISDSKAQQEELKLLRNEAIGLANQQRLKIAQGVDQNSQIILRMEAQLNETLKKVNELTTSDIKTSVSELDGTNGIFETEDRILEQTNSVEQIKNSNAFYQAKAAKLETALVDLKNQLTLRMIKEQQRLQTERLVTQKEKLIANLETASVRLDFADFKAVRRLEFFPGAILEKSIMPLSSLILSALILGLFLGVCAGFIQEVRDPSLRQMSHFEELKMPVLGGIPADKDFLISSFNASRSDHQSTMLAYSRLGIRLDNVLSFIKSKVVMFTAAESASLSSMLAFNLATYYARTGRRTLVIETDFINNFLSKFTGARMGGGLESVYANNPTEELKIHPFHLEENLHILTGDGSSLPAIYRSASNGFHQLISALGAEYDYIFIHAHPCLIGPEAADLSRYAGLSVICSETKNLKISKLRRLSSEMNLFLSRYSYFVLQGAEDRGTQYDIVQDDSNFDEHENFKDNSWLDKFPTKAA